MVNRLFGLYSVATESCVNIDEFGLLTFALLFHRTIHRAKQGHFSRSIDLNCMDPLGRGALLMAIDNENLQVFIEISFIMRSLTTTNSNQKMIELLVAMGIATRDALLHAIDKEFVEVGNRKQNKT